MRTFEGGLDGLRLCGHCIRHLEGLVIRAGQGDLQIDSCQAAHSCRMPGVQALATKTGKGKQGPCQEPLDSRKPGQQPISPASDKARLQGLKTLMLCTRDLPRWLWRSPRQAHTLASLATVLAMLADQRWGPGGTALGRD